MEKLIENIDWEIDNEALKFKVRSCLETVIERLKVYADYKASFDEGIENGDLEMAQVVHDTLMVQGTGINGYLHCLEAFIPYEFQFYTAGGTIFLQAGLRTIWSYNYK